MTNETQPNEVPELPLKDLSDTQPRKLSETQPTVVNAGQESFSDPNGTQPLGVSVLPDLNETQPQGASQEADMEQTQMHIEQESVGTTQPKATKKSRAGFWISLLILICAIAVGGVSGYGKGVQERVNAQKTLVSQQLGDQFALVQQDIDAGRYGMARQRLEFIINQDPGYPGASDKLAQVLVEQAITPSPVPTETPLPTPTPDMRNQEAIFAQAKQQLTDKNWTDLIGSLDSLRKEDPTYKTAIVDGMYYTALRNRGMDQILGVGAYKTTNMEGGMYDLTLAERFGPLDGYADGLRTWARLYIQGASFWDVNWEQAVNVFRQVASYAPNLRDSSNVTSSQRLYQALLKYGDQLAELTRKNDRCSALDVWTEASKISALSNDYQNKFNDLNNQCNPPTEVPIPTVAAP